MSVSETIPHAPSRARTLTPTQYRHAMPLRGVGVIASLDSLAAVVAILSVLVTVNLSNIAGSVQDFLAVRITVKNILLLILLATTWPVIFQIGRAHV